MKQRLSPLLAAGYGASAAAALLALWAGAGIVAAGLIFWLGGAVGVIAVASVVFVRMPHSVAASVDLDCAQDLLAWEDDRQAESREAAVASAPAARAVNS